MDNLLRLAKGLRDTRVNLDQRVRPCRTNSGVDSCVNGMPSSGHTRHGPCTKPRRLYGTDRHQNPLISIKSHRSLFGRSKLNHGITLGPKHEEKCKCIMYVFYILGSDPFSPPFRGEVPLLGKLLVFRESPNLRHRSDAHTSAPGIPGLDSSPPNTKSPYGHSERLSWSVLTPNDDLELFPAHGR
jgi:hypothetical protein